MRGVAALLLFSSAAAAQAAPLRVGGYWKTLWQANRSLTDRRDYWQDQSRAALQFEAAHRGWNAYLDYRLEFLLGTYQQTADFRRFGYPRPNFWWNLEDEIDSHRNTSLRQGLFRAWGGWEGEGTVVRAGRQRVAWGTGRFWNPTDILNEYQPLSLEREERHGVDALYVRRSLGTLSQLEGVWAPHADWKRSALLARFKGNLRGLDWGFSGGKAPGENDAFLLGAEGSVDVFEGNLHAEAAYRDPGNPDPPAIPLALIPAGANVAPRPVFWRGVLGYEYRWGADAPLPWILKDAWTSVEFYRNGSGQTDSTRYRFADLLLQQELFLGRHYGGFGYERDLNPLWNLKVNGIVNFDDESFYFGPSLRWNPKGNLYLTAAVQFFSGKAGTEYGSLSTTPYAIAQYYF